MSRHVTSRHVTALHKALAKVGIF
ncbi:unnamed protein product [Victoria cruziana]